MKIISGLVGAALTVWGIAAIAAPMDLASNDVMVKTPHVQMASVGNSAAEVFMELDNKSPYPRYLVAANSPVAMQTQLHMTFTQNGAEQMKQVDKIAIKPNGDRELQPGGFHVMLMGLKQALKTGDKVPVTLIFADGSSIAVTATVG